MALFSFFEIETTTVCNLRCPTCPVSVSPRPVHFMDESLFSKAVEELAGMGFAGTFSPHFYNEPLADERLPRLLRLAKTVNPAMRIVLFTNTTLMTPQLFRELADSGVEEFVVSTDNPVIARSCERLLAELGPPERGLVRTRTISNSALYNRGGTLTGLPGLTQPATCRAPSDYMVVDAWGEVLLCYNDYLREHPLGSLAKRTILDIWNDPAYEKIRLDAAKGHYTQGICHRCRLSSPA